MSPSEKHNILFPKPSLRWDEAMHLGNGMQGALVWGNGDPLNISLNRADLWDLQPVPEYESMPSPDYSYATLRRWKQEGNAAKIAALYDTPYDRPTPTKIPAGRLELFVASPYAPLAWKHGAMDLRRALAQIEWNDGSQTEVFVHAREPVGAIRVRLSSESASPLLRLLTPPFAGADGARANNGGANQGSLAQLGYLAPVESAGPDWQAFEQRGARDFSFAVYVGWKRVGNDWEGVWSVASRFEGAHPLQIARKRVEAALSSGFEALLRSHESWWSDYWNQSSLTLPDDPLIERLWYAEQYRLGSASRRGAPPVTLQGPWTADEGKLPPWKGDYHNDLNTELSYWPVYSANHLEEGLSFIDWLWQTREENRRWTQKWWDKPGVNVPGVSDLAGRPMGGWAMYSFSGTTGCWLAHHFYLHWRYSQDHAFLTERAYPYLHDVATFVEAVTERAADGKRFLSLSSSPEINDNSLHAWFDSTTNYDLSLIRWLLSAVAELANEAKKLEEAAHWRTLLGEFPELAKGANDGLLVAPGVPPQVSHRHLSWLMAIHPLGLISPEDGPAAQRTIAASLAEIDRLGTAWWCGYTYSWLANMKARAGDGEGARRALETFATAFTLPNGFHVNGDQTGTKHFSNFTYRPFTLEGNFAAAAGVQEMLLQSRGGVLRVFPATPSLWKNASFSTLRAEGAFLVSATREEGKVTHVEIRSERGGACRLISPWSGQELRFVLKPGERHILRQEPA